MLVLLALLILFLIGYDKKVELVEPTEPVAPAEPLEPKEKSSQSAIYSQLHQSIACNVNNGIILPDMIFSQAMISRNNRIENYGFNFKS